MEISEIVENIMYHVDSYEVNSKQELYHALIGKLHSRLLDD